MFKKASKAGLIPGLIVSMVLVGAFVLSGHGAFVSGTLVSCSGAGLIAAPPSLAASGATVVETGSATCVGPYGGSTPEFRFWQFDNVAQRWSMVQNYSQTATHNWNTTGLPDGNYRLEVDVRSINETVAYDTVANITYHIGLACTNAGLTVTGGTSGGNPTGGTYVMTGSSATCPNPVYRFWIKDPGGAWSMVQDYSATTTHTWGPVGTGFRGQYGMEVDVRDASETTAYDVVHNITFTLVGCTGATLSGAPASGTVAHGAGNVTLTATASCLGTPTYRFWILDPGGTHWSMVKDYSTTATYTWIAASQRAGVSHIEVDVRDQGSLEIYEFATSGITYSFS